MLLGTLNKNRNVTSHLSIVIHDLQSFLRYYKAINRLHLGIWSKVLHFKAMHPALLSLECLVQLPWRISHYIPAICGVGWKWLTHFGEHATDSYNGWLIAGSNPSRTKNRPSHISNFQQGIHSFPRQRRGHRGGGNLATSVIKRLRFASCSMRQGEPRIGGL